MRGSTRTWPILVLGFGALLILIVLSSAAGIRMADSVYQQTAEIHRSHSAAEQALSGLRSEVFLGSIHLRDFLLDPSDSKDALYLQLIEETRRHSEQHLDRLRELWRGQDEAGIQRLATEMSDYWNSMQPVFEWESNASARYRFVEQEVLPRRRTLLSVAQQIQDLHTRNYVEEQEQLTESWLRFQTYYRNTALLALFLGLIGAALGVHRTIRLERRALEQQKRSERAERELRKLSSRLVHAQEGERKALSRELHDQIGQMLTGLRLEIGNLGKIQEQPSPEFQSHLAEAKQLAEQTLRVVRDLAMGLRPAMLDDLGIEPALRWLAREFARRSQIEITVNIKGSLEGLSDEQRTCLFRVVQESLTNCARHAQAERADIVLERSADDLIHLSIRDNGRGFVAGEVVGKGIGLLGIEERVRELGGRLSIESGPGKGTCLAVQLPLEVRSGSD